MFAPRNLPVIPERNSLREPTGRHMALDIAPNFGIIKGGSNDVAISEEKESEVLGAWE